MRQAAPCSSDPAVFEYCLASTAFLLLPSFASLLVPRPGSQRRKMRGEQRSRPPGLHPSRAGRIMTSQGARRAPSKRAIDERETHLEAKPPWNSELARNVRAD